MDELEVLKLTPQQLAVDGALSCTSDTYELFDSLDDVEARDEDRDDEYDLCDSVLVFEEIGRAHV